MPTGVEETLAAAAAMLTAALEEGVAASPFAGVPDPAGSAMDAADVSGFGTTEVAPSAEVQEGDPSARAGANAGAAPDGSIPVSGDLPTESAKVTEYTFEPLEFVVGGSAPAADPADVEAPGQAASPPPLPPTPEPNRPDSSYILPPAQIVPFAPGELDDRQAPPAGEREPDAPDSGPQVVPEREPGPWTAGLADRWEETVKYTPSAFLFDQSGEEVNQRAKQAVEDWLAKNLLDDQPDQSEGARLAKVAVAGVLKSASDVGLDMIVTPVLDPGTVVRGVMRTGVASAQGMHDIEEGKTLEGSMKIVGEVSGVVLMVLAPVRAGGAKAVRPIRPGEPSITMYSERIGFPTSRAAAIESKTAHNIVEVRRPQAPMRRTDVVPKAVGELGQERLIARVRENPGVDNSHSFTRPMTPAEAEAAIRMMDTGLGKSYAGVPGGVGPFGSFAEHCATHAGGVARAGGVWTTGKLGPHVNFYLFKYMSPLGAQTGAALVTAAENENHNYPR